MTIAMPQMRGILARGVAGGTDADFASVAFGSHWNGTNGVSSPYVDFSSHATNATTGGSDSLTTTSPLFGTACLAVSSVRVSLPSTASSFWTIGTGDFCFETAFKTASPATSSCIVDWNIYLSNGANAFMLRTTGSQFQFYVNGSGRITGGTVSTSTWQRVAVARVSGTTRMFVDGTQVGSNYTDGNSYSNAASIYFGGDTQGFIYSAAKYDATRITIGAGRYSANYTVAAAEFPNS